MLEKVISGGQTGADRGGLIAAKRMGISTGGWIPKGYLTENGSEPQLGEEFGLVETESKEYPVRTRLNAKIADGTIRFARNFDSAGEKCTLRALRDYKKPYIDVDVMTLHADPCRKLSDVVRWIKENNIQVLNVAGNRESTCPGIQDYTVDFLVEVFKVLKNASVVAGSECESGN